MCGICGAIQIGGNPREPVAPTTLAWMTDVMTHRGPNDRGLLTEPGVSMGVRRLSIVDVEGGHQPIANEAGDVWAIQNGELYTHKDIRRMLAERGHAFRTSCDTEVIPHLYEEFGGKFPEQLRGMFAIAVWDRRRRRAVLARDRLGIKPLYYAKVRDVLVFGSELKSVLASGLVEPSLDYEAIEAYLTLGFFPGPRTPLLSVSKLMPGHVLTVSEAGVESTRYWSYPKPNPDPELNDERRAAEELVAQLSESVRLRLMSDVPLGAMLSGGIDSTLIVALMAREMHEPVKTFSVGFRGAARGNELEDARFVASTFATEHHELELSLDEHQVELEDLVWHLDEPLADLSSLGFHALSELAARHVTVALSGQGADELFGGYQKHRAAAITGAWKRLPGPVQRLGTTVGNHGPARLRRAARTLAAKDAAERLLAMSRIVSDSTRAALVRQKYVQANASPARAAIRRYVDNVPDDPLPATLYADAQLGLVDDMLHYFDRASMAHSLEVRVPFLDHHFVEFAARIPPELKVRRLTTKFVLKRAARGLIPDRIIDKPKIGFFNAAVQSWFGAQANGAIRDYLLAPNPAYEDVLDRTTVVELVRRFHVAPTKHDGHLLLAILMLELWLSSYLPRALATDSASAQAVALVQ